MNKYLIIAATVGAIATPALADEVGVHVGPVGAGVTVGQDHRDYDRSRDSDRTTTIVKEREPTDRTMVIKRNTTTGSKAKPTSPTMTNS